MSEKHIDKISGVETTGHEWDGIRELNNPMPRWWVWTFYFTILWAIGYTIAYPAWPLISGATHGVLGWNSRGEIAADLAAAKQSQSVFVDKIASSSLADIQADPTLRQFALSAARPHSRSIASSATVRVPRAGRDIPTSMMTTGCGAAASTISIRR